MKDGRRLKPRDYQVEAYKWAYERGRAVVCMPTGAGKTLIAGLWIRELLRSGRARRILVLEPTRFLVEQTASFLRERLGIDARPLHGSLPLPARRAAWSARVIVATPEIVVAEWELFTRAGFDALVVDECHHTTGQDPYRYVVSNYDFKYRLGLTALIPESRRREIEEYIGEIRCWPWTHPSLSRYIPPWAAEIYESPLNDTERRLYESLERLWDEAVGRDRMLLGNAIRWFVRDGAAALRESAERSERLRRVLGKELIDMLYNPQVREAHKLDALRSILRDHEGFSKTIVFVDRVVIANIIAKATSRYGVALILGRRHIEPSEALKRAKSEDVKLIVASSAGEEGIDLPEADLLVLWSNTASPLRFVQRLGRILRPRKGLSQKYVAFIATPDTVDVDSLIDGIAQASKAGVYVAVTTETVKRLIEMSRRRRFLDVLYERPLPADLLAQALGASIKRVEDALRWLISRGYVGYIYTPLGRVYYPLDRPDLARKYYEKYLKPLRNIKATIQIICNGERARVVRNADYQRALTHVLRALERCKALKGVRATVFLEERGLITAHNIAYNYVIPTDDVAKLVVDNIYALPSYKA
jgi:superfamily II DNA or RNA helicase